MGRALNHAPGPSAFLRQSLPLHFGTVFDHLRLRGRSEEDLSASRVRRELSIGLIGPDLAHRPLNPDLTTHRMPEEDSRSSGTRLQLHPFARIVVAVEDNATRIEVP